MESYYQICNSYLRLGFYYIFSIYFSRKNMVYIYRRYAYK